MRLILFIGLFFFFEGKISHAQPFKIVDATSKQWIGGRKDSGAGVNYNFKIVPSKSSKKLSFQKVWIDTMCFDVDELVDRNYQPITSFNKKDTIIIRVAWISGGPNYKTLPDCKPAPPAIKTMKNFVEYKYRGKVQYLHIRNLRMLEKQYRQ